MSKPLLSFGLLTDVQYADVDDAWNFHQTMRRYYRGALPLLESAVADWVEESKSKDSQLKFLVSLGDLIDGKNKMADTSRPALDDAIAAFRPFQQHVGDVHHVVGNHELYNFPTTTIYEELCGSKAQEFDGYYDFTVPSAPNVRFIFLNCYGLSVLGRDADHPVAKEATELIRKVNPNDSLNSPEGLPMDRRRFVAFNGAIDARQMQWLEETLTQAEDEKQDVVIFTHVPIHPDSAVPVCMLWNYPEVLALLNRHHKCVRAVFSGHSHEDAYVEENGIHYVVSDAILECASHETAYATVHVHSDRLEIVGRGKVPCRVLPFKS